MRIRCAHVRTGFKTGCGLRKGGIVGPSIHPRIRYGIGVRKAGKNAGKTYYKYK